MEQEIDNTSITESCGNIFEDMGMPNADEELAKAQISIRIERLIEERGLTQTEAARRMGLAQSDVSRIVCGRLDGFTLDRLLSCLTALGQDVRIVIAPASAAGERGQLSVAGAS